MYKKNLAILDSPLSSSARLESCMKAFVLIASINKFVEIPVNTIFLHPREPNRMVRFPLYSLHVQSQ